MEDSNERVTQDAERGEDTTQTEVKLSAEEAVAKMQNAFEESKSYRKKLAERGQELDAMRQELKALRENAEKEKGNYKELYSKTATELEAERQARLKERSSYAKRVIHGSIKEKLLESKCSRPDAILRLMQDQILELEVDNEFNPDSIGVKGIVEQSMKDYPEWFKSETPKINDVTPSGKLPSKPLSEMSQKEIEAALAALDKR